MSPQKTRLRDRFSFSAEPVDDPNKVVAYTTLQLLVGVLALALPIVLLISIRFFGSHHLPGSISAFYYTPMRNYFVGTLCALGLVFYSYRYAPRDNWLSNIAAALVIFVALCPTAPPGASYSIVNKLHIGAAIAFLALLGFFSLFLFTRSNMPKRSQDRGKVWRNRIYRGCGATIFVAIALAGLVGAFTSLQWLFWWETIALVAFAISWLVKGLGGKSWHFL